MLLLTCTFKKLQDEDDYKTLIVHNCNLIQIYIPSELFSLFGELKTNNTRKNSIYLVVLIYNKLSIKKEEQQGEDGKLKRLSIRMFLDLLSCLFSLNASFFCASFFFINCLYPNFMPKYFSSIC